MVHFSLLQQNQQHQIQSQLAHPDPFQVSWPIWQISEWQLSPVTDYFQLGEDRLCVISVKLLKVVGKCPECRSVVFYCAYFLATRCTELIQYRLYLVSFFSSHHCGELCLNWIPFWHDVVRLSGKPHQIVTRFILPMSPILFSESWKMLTWSGSFAISHLDRYEWVSIQNEHLSAIEQLFKE